MIPTKNDPTLRTAKTQKKYIDYVQNKYDGSCIFCAKDELIQEFKHFILVKNKFPYDGVFKNHRMLAPKKHVVERVELSEEAIIELEELLQTLDYDMCILNKKRNRSIPLHFHYHLVTIK